MRMAELSETTGTPVATVKFYLREGLLPAGERLGPTQASYGEQHVRRLRLIRALIDVGGLSIARIKQVFAAMDDPDVPVVDVLGRAQEQVSADMAPADDDFARLAQDRLAALVQDRDWHTSRTNPGWSTAVTALQAFLRVGTADLLGILPAYGEAAEVVAQADLSTLSTADSRSDLVEKVVVGTTLGDPLFAALRRLAQEHMAHKHFPA